MCDDAVQNAGAQQFSVRDGSRFQDDEDKRRLANHVAGLLPEDEVVVYGNNKDRNLSIDRQIEPSDDLHDRPAEWTSKRLSEGEIGYILTGYGTEYMLTANLDRPELLPTLSWPSNRGVVVLGVEVVGRESEIRVGKTASDIYWRIERYNGR